MPTVRPRHCFAVLAISACYGWPAAVAGLEQTEAHRTCDAMDVDLRFLADRYEKAWYPNKSIPFNFANAFDFSPPSKFVMLIAYARMERVGSDVRLQFFSSDRKLLWERSLIGDRVECNDGRTVVAHSVSVHGGDGFGGSKRVVTTTFSRAGDKVHVVTSVQIDSTVLFVKGPSETRQMWSEFTRYSADR